MRRTEIRPDASAKREAMLLGQPPRLSPLRIEDFSAEALALTDRMMRSVGNDRRELSLETIPELIPTLMRHPGLFARITDLSLQLLAHGALPARDRELAVLRLAWLCQAPYEWGEHVPIAKRCGVTDAEIGRIIAGPDADGWSPADAALIRAVDELYGDAMISDGTWAMLASRYGDQELIELPILVGQFQSVAYLQNALRLRLDRDNPGLSAR
ncbi:MAG: carboxymuconolactone decarboxylase family protein [Sphingomonas sp.]